MDSFYLSITLFDFFLLNAVIGFLFVFADYLLARYNKFAEEDKKVDHKKFLKHSLFAYFAIVVLLLVWFIDRVDNTSEHVVRSFDSIPVQVEIPKTEVVAPNRESVRQQFTITVEKMGELE